MLLEHVLTEGKRKKKHSKRRKPKVLTFASRRKKSRTGTFYGFGGFGGFGGYYWGMPGGSNGSGNGGNGGGDGGGGGE